MWQLSAAILAQPAQAQAYFVLHVPPPLDLLILGQELVIVTRNILTLELLLVLHAIMLVHNALDLPQPAALLAMHSSLEFQTVLVPANARMGISM